MMSSEAFVIDKVLCTFIYIMMIIKNCGIPFYSCEIYHFVASDLYLVSQW